MQGYQKEYQRWLGSPYIDEATKKELREISNNESEIKERFFSQMSFGTAGLRSVMKAGISSINVYTVAHATRAIARLIEDLDKKDRGVVIAYDCRINSALFAKTAAAVLASNKIKVFLFGELRPTPELSFALRELGCVAGINITASHNPKEYNGYKAYWEDGAQLPPEEANIIGAYMKNIDVLAPVPDFDTEKEKGYIEILEEDFDEKYIEKVIAELVDPTLIPDAANDLKIVYTPLHGTGYRLIPEVLRRVGVKHLFGVESQQTPNGNFPTTPKPNPEYEQSFIPGIEVANKENADIVIATDPDADRTGVVIRTADGNFIPLTGNQIGALLCDYIMSAYEDKNCVPSNPYIVKSIVSTEMATPICKAHNVKLYNVLTGFKYIGEVIKKHEKEGKGSFILGFEESYGYLKGTYARDKDAVVATMLIVEMTAYYRKKNMTLYDALTALYEKYEYYKEKLEEIYLTGIDGREKINAIMDNYRKNPPSVIAGEALASVRDYQSGLITDVRTGKTEPTNLPTSNVLYFETENKNIAIVRPSGTEPKIKFYYLCHSDSKDKAEMLANAMKKQFSGAIKTEAAE